MKRLLILLLLAATAFIASPASARENVTPGSWVGQWDCTINGRDRVLHIKTIFQGYGGKKWVRGALNYPDGKRRQIVQRRHSRDDVPDVYTTDKAAMLPLYSFDPSLGEDDPGRTKIMLLMHLNGADSMRRASGYAYWQSPDRRKRVPNPIDCRKR